MNKGTVRILSLVCLAVAATSPALAQKAPAVALSDFSINSSNPKYTFLGKGFTEIVSFELQKSSAIRLVDREQRNAALSEMEFSLSGITEEGSQLEVGKLLSVRYVVYGSITDMGDVLVVSLKMLDVETTEIVWTDQVMEPGSKYSYIGAYLAKSLLTYFKAKVDRSTEATVAAGTSTSADAVVALSAGVAALDAGKKDEAKARLEEARSIDPTSGAINAMLGKLASASAKFKVVPERYVSYYNPAYLAGMGKDKAYVSYSNGWHTYGFYDTNNSQTIARDGSESWGVGESRYGITFGYAYPVGRDLGLGAELMTANWKDSVVNDEDLTVVEYAQAGNQQTMYTGGDITAGFALGPRVSIGLGAMAAMLDRKYYILNKTDNDYISGTFWALGGLLSAAVRNAPGTLVWDIMGSWSTEPQFWFDTESMAFSRNAAPIYVEQTLTAVLAKGRAFLALKQVNDIFPDRETYYLRAMPMFEFWPLEFAALRVGAEGSMVIKLSGTAYGWGATAGLSIKLWKLELDVNYTLRQRPSRSLSEVVIPESIFFLSASMDGILKN